MITRIETLGSIVLETLFQKPGIKTQQLLPVDWSTSPVTGAADNLHKLEHGRSTSPAQHLLRPLKFPTFFVTNFVSVQRSLDFETNGCLHGASIPAMPPTTNSLC